MGRLRRVGVGGVSEGSESIKKVEGVLLEEEKMEEGTGVEDDGGDEDHDLAGKGTRESFNGEKDGAMRGSDGTEKDTKERVMAGGTSGIVVKEEGGLGLDSVAGELKKLISLQTQKMKIGGSKEDDRFRDLLQKIDAEDPKMVTASGHDREEGRGNGVPYFDDFGDEKKAEVPSNMGGGNPMAVDHPLGKFVGFFNFR